MQTLLHPQQTVTIGYIHYGDATSLTPVTSNRQIRFELNHDLKQLQIFIDVIFQASFTQIQEIHPNLVTLVNVSQPAQRRLLNVIPFNEQAFIIGSLSSSTLCSIASTPQTGQINGHYEKVLSIFIPV